MLTYVLIAAALFLGCVGASLVSLNLLGAALFPIPVVVYWVRGRPGRAIGLVAAAGLAALVSMGTWGAVLYYILLAAIGFPLGLGIARHWTYARTVTVAAGFAYVLVAGNLLLAWPDWVAQGGAMYDLWIAELQQQQAGTDREYASALVQNATWLKDHWPELGLGLMLWPILVETCLGLSLLSAWLRRRFGAEGVRGSFRSMRTSEWLVWAAIGVAVLGLIDYRWPGTALRVVSWNAGLALASIYWLNGFSILVYALDALRPHVLLYVPIVAVLVWFGIHPVLCFVGFFDTWSNFRKMLDGLAAARKKMSE